MIIIFTKTSWKVERWNRVTVTNAELIDLKNNKQAVKLTLVNQELDSRNFLVFTNNTYLINQLLEIAYGSFEVQSADEKDFIGLEFSVWLQEHNGYLIVKQIG